MNKVDSFIGRHSIFVTVIIIVLILLLCLALSFGFFSLLVYLCCWAFGYSFSWKLAIGAYAIVTILGMIFKTTVTVKEK